MDQNQENLSGNATSDSSVLASDSVSSGVVYGSFWLRAAALVIDSFIIGAFTALFSFGISGSDFISPGYNSAEEIVATILNVFVAFAYYVGMLWKKGATLGKMVVGLAVVRSDGNHLTLGRAALREIVGKFVSNITLLVGYLIAGFTKRKQGLHDMIADTVVVDLRPEDKRTGWKVFGIFFTVVFPVIMIVLIFILFMFVLGGVSSLYKNPQDSPNSNIKISSRLVLEEVRYYAITYANNNGTLRGYEPTTSMGGYDSSREEEVVMKLSSDGKKAAFYLTDDYTRQSGKLLCSDVDIDNVNSSYNSQIDVDADRQNSPNAFVCK